MTLDDQTPHGAAPEPAPQPAPVTAEPLPPIVIQAAPAGEEAAPSPAPLEVSAAESPAAEAAVIPPAVDPIVPGLVAQATADDASLPVIGTHVTEPAQPEAVEVQAVPAPFAEPLRALFGEGPTTETGSPPNTEGVPAEAPRVAPAEPAGGVEAEPLAPEAVDTAPADPSPPSPTAAPPVPAAGVQGGVSDDLEEEVYAPSVTAQGPQVGDERGGWRLTADLGRGWFRAAPVGGGQEHDVYARPAPLWAELRPHRLLPRFSVAEGLTVLDPPPEEVAPLAPPLPAPEALGHLTELARLLFALDRQGYVVTDLDPQAVRLTKEGLKLRFPPRVVRSGETEQAALRDGFTPPELLAGEAAQPASGVYVLGALLYAWLTGQPLPAEGPSPSLLGAVAVPGMPQLLTRMLAPLPGRPSPEALLATLRAQGAGPLPAYRVSARTTVGLNPDRPVNEDSYGYVLREVDAEGEGGRVLRLRACVSDGMGGMAAGEVASRAAVEGFLDSAQPELAEQVWDANAAVLAAMAGRDGGCTISGVQIDGDRMRLGHVGDTRAYLRAGGEVRQLTQDHSFVAAMVASGQMTPGEAQVSPERNKVLRSLGSLRQPQPDYVQTLSEPLTLQPGDRVLLVSDGVWGEVEPATLTALLRDEADGERLIDQLIELSLESGAPDNATALLIERGR